MVWLNNESGALKGTESGGILSSEIAGKLHVIHMLFIESANSCSFGLRNLKSITVYL